MRDPDVSSELVVIAGCSRAFHSAASAALRRQHYSVTDYSRPADSISDCQRRKVDLLITEFDDFIQEELSLGHEDPYTHVPRIYVSRSQREITRPADVSDVFGWLIEPSSEEQVVVSVAVALSRAQRTRELIEQVDGLNRAMNQRREVSIATGIVMERSRVSEQEAFEIVRRKARSSRRKLADLAADMLDAFRILSLSESGASSADRQSSSPTRKKVSSAVEH